MDLNREEIIQQWDKWRKYIAEGGGGSWPRDAFEAILDMYDEELDNYYKQLQELQANLDRIRNTLLMDLNREVAEKVMGWELAQSARTFKHYWIDKNGLHKYYVMDWKPILDLNQCFEVVEQTREKGFAFDMHSDTPFADHKQYHAGFQKLKVMMVEDKGQDYFGNIGKTPQEAILKAALKAVDENEINT